MRRLKDTLSTSVIKLLAVHTFAQTPNKVHSPPPSDNPPLSPATPPILSTLAGKTARTELLEGLLQSKLSFLPRYSAILIGESLEKSAQESKDLEKKKTHCTGDSRGWLG